MIFLWIGLPVIALLFRFISAESSGQTILFTLISALIVSSIGGTLASVMLAVFIINEKNRHVYDLFLIRPLKRRDILLAKFYSVYTCVAKAAVFAVLAGMVTDYATTGALPATVLTNSGDSLATSLSMIAVACSAGVLIGVAAPSVRIGAILVFKAEPNFSDSTCANIVVLTRCNGLHDCSGRRYSFRITCGRDNFV